jgi:anion-transporting  ArsA/GET3 family ATPase
MGSEFDTTLDLYRRNLVEYKVSGNAAFKVAAENAKKWLDDSLKTMETNADKNKKEIEEFVKNYDKSDKELAELKADMQKIREEGPELQVTYETEHESLKEEEAAVDYTAYYTKGAVLAGVIALAAVASVI